MKEVGILREIALQWNMNDLKMYQSSTIVGTSLKHIVYVKQVLHFICIPNKPLKTCGGGQPYL